MRLVELLQRPSLRLPVPLGQSRHFSGTPVTCFVRNTHCRRLPESQRSYWGPASTGKRASNCRLRHMEGYLATFRNLKCRTIGTHGSTVHSNSQAAVLCSTSAEQITSQDGSRYYCNNVSHTGPIKLSCNYLSVTTMSIDAAGHSDAHQCRAAEAWVISEDE